MKRTTEIHLSDDDVRLAVIEFIVSRELASVVATEQVRFGVERGYDGEMGGPSTPNRVEAYVEF